MPRRMNLKNISQGMAQKAGHNPGLVHFGQIRSLTKMPNVCEFERRKGVKPC